jgi:hypothetical protein
MARCSQTFPDGFAITVYFFKRWSGTAEKLLPFSYLFTGIIPIYGTYQ